VLGLVKDVGSLSTIVSAKQGNKEIFKRDLTIVDDSATEIRLTLWGKQAQDETIGWDAKPIVAFKGCKIGDYGGRTLSLLNNGSLTVAPKIPEGAALYQWVQAQGGDASNIKASNISSGGGSGGGGKDLFENRKPVSSIKIEDMGHGEKPDWVQMKLNLLYAKADNDPWYTACTQENCKKKVVENMTGGYRCESCNIDTEGCVRRYILSTQMGDYSGSEWFSFFDEQATALLGKTADEMHNLKQLEGDDVFQAEVRKALFKQYVVKAKVKVEDVRGEMRKKCSVFSLEPVNFVTESQKMIEAIAKYQ
jgi:replication factor A1